VVALHRRRIDAGVNGGRGAVAVAAFYQPHPGGVAALWSPVMARLIGAVFDRIAVPAARGFDEDWNAFEADDRSVNHFHRRDFTAKYFWISTPPEKIVYLTNHYLVK
jgi:hypothetical protein